MRKLLAEIPPEHHDLTYLLAVTGCRISEALAPIWSEFGVDHDGRPTLIIPTSKTEAGIRTLALTPELARRLMARRNTSPFPADEHPIFPTMRGTRMDGHNWRQRVFNPARQRAGMPWMTPHKLRHGMATVMAERGKGADEIAKQLGHADGGTLALKTYIHRRTAGPTDYMDDVLIVN